LIIYLITVGKRSGAVVSVLLILFVSCLLLYLDHVIPALSLGRASSYIAGVVIGTIYYTKSKMWTQLESILKIPFINVLILFSFLFVLWGDMYFRAAYPGVFSLYSLYYFYVSSWIISLVILASIVPDTLFYKIFSNKILVFLGLISFAMYLIHPTTIRWNYALYLHFVHFNHHDAYHIAFTIIFITTVITTVAVSYFIHKLVERLYFEK